MFAAGMAEMWDPSEIHAKYFWAKVGIWGHFHEIDFLMEPPQNQSAKKTTTLVPNAENSSIFARSKQEDTCD